MSKKKGKLITEVTPEDYGRQITSQLTTEVLRLIEHDGKTYGPDWQLTVQLNVVASILSTLVYRSLSEPPPATRPENPEELGSLSRSGYAGLKDAIESTVTAAFQGAFQTHKGQSAEFFVQILEVPEPVNSLPC